MTLLNLTTKVFSSTYGKILLLLIGLSLILVVFQYPKAGDESTLGLESAGTDSLIIPSINVNTPIVYVDSHEQTEIEKGLVSGVVHLKGTPMPGDTGNSFIISDSFNYLQNLPQVKIGDDILVTRNNKESLVYTVTDIKIDSHSYMKAWSEGNYERGRFLTLQASYSQGGGQMRYLVIAELK